MSKKNKKQIDKSEKAVNAYKPKFNDIKSDVSGSYTGLPEADSEPVQDVDDL